MIISNEQMDLFCRRFKFPNNREEFRLSDEYYYQSLPLCVIDAIFSIGVRYEGTRNVVKRFCEVEKIQRIRGDRNKLPDVSNQFSVSQYLIRYGNTRPEILAANIFENFQRTSTRNGILKAEAVGTFMRELRKRKVDFLQDIPKISGDEGFENAIKSIPGQKSGISLQYFFMLSGDNTLVKPDRMVLRFLAGAFPGIAFDVRRATLVLQEICKYIRLNKGIDISPRELDHWIWRNERGK
jgi:hypothetical protein